MLLILLDFAGQAAKVRLYFVCGPRIDLVGLAQEVERKQALAASLSNVEKITRSPDAASHDGCRKEPDCKRSQVLSKKIKWRLPDICAIAVSPCLPIAFGVVVHDFYPRYPFCPLVSVLVFGHQLQGKTSILRQSNIVDPVSQENVVLPEILQRQRCGVAISGSKKNISGSRLKAREVQKIGYSEACPSGIKSPSFNTRHVDEF